MLTDACLAHLHSLVLQGALIGPDQLSSLLDEINRLRDLDKGRGEAHIEQTRKLTDARDEIARYQNALNQSLAKDKIASCEDGPTTFRTGYADQVPDRLQNRIDLLLEANHALAKIAEALLARGCNQLPARCTTPHRAV